MSIRFKSLAVSLIIALLLISGTLALLGGVGCAPPPVLAQGPDGDAVYYVAPDCTGAPTPCFTSVQAAVDAVDDPADAVWVATGIYTGVNSHGGLSQVAYISKSLTLRGGYNADFSEWDPDTHPTTLDAEGEGRVLYVTGGTITPTIAGLIITNGDALGLGGAAHGPYDAGGGVYVRWTPVNVQNCTIQDSTAKNSGGGIFLYRSAAQISHTAIRNNTSNKSAGGLYAYQSPATISDSFIEHNSAPSDMAGGLYINASALVIRNSTVQSNTAAAAGGVYAISAADGRVENSTIQGNSATTYNGGGLYVQGTGPFTLRNNLVRGNTAQGNGGGAYVYCGGPFPMQNNIFADNVADDQGGGVYFAWCASNQGRLENTAFVGNHAAGGGSAFVSSNGATMLLHTTLSDNRGSTGVHVSSGSQVVFTNTLIHSHTLGINNSSGAVDMTQTLWDANGTDAAGSVNRIGDITGTAALSADGYHVTATSDAVDQGVGTDVEADADGQPRSMGYAPDLGADEYAFSSDLALIKTGPSSAIPKEVLTYTLTVSNAATSEVEADARVVDAVTPASAVAALRASAQGDTCTAGGAVVTCTLTNVATDTMRTITVWVTPTSTYNGILTNTATVTPTNAVDTNGADNADAVTTTVTYIAPISDLWVEKDAPAFVEPGAPLRYDLSWGNAGAMTATSVIMTDTLPGGVSFQSADPPPDSTDPLVWNLGDLAPGETATATLRAVVGTLDDATALINHVAISGTMTENVKVNNTDTATTTVSDLGGYNLALEKAGDPAEVEVGDTIGYALWVTNTGELPADVALQDAIPAGTEYVAGSASALGGTGSLEDSNGITWIGRLDINENVLIIFDVKVVACEGIACGTIRNIATAEIDGVAYLWQKRIDTIVRCPDLTISGAGPERSPQFSDGTFKRYDVTFTYENKNDHANPGAAHTSTVTITLPEGAQFSASTPIADETSPDKRTKVWRLGDLAAGAKDTLHVQVAPHRWLDEGVGATAIIASEPGIECDSNAPNQDTVTTYPTKMALEKRAENPRWTVTQDPKTGKVTQRMMVDYYLRYHYQTPDPHRPPVSSYRIDDHWPSSLTLERHAGEPKLEMQIIGARTTSAVDQPTTVRFNGTGYLRAGDPGWLRLQGATTVVTPGQVIVNEAEEVYETQKTQGTGVEVYTDSARVAVLAPLTPPLITFPEEGNTCAGDSLEVRGVAQPGVTVTVYMDGDSEPATPVAQIQTDAQGRFAANVAIPAGSEFAVSYLVAEAGRAGETSEASNRVMVGAPTWGGWCPQRSYWEGTLQAGPNEGQHRTYVFRGKSGMRRTRNWQVAGEYGFWDTQLHLYTCCTDATQAMTVTADGVVYTPASRDGHWYHFDITGGAHDVTIESRCGDEVGAESGVVLIDPDGYVFDIDQGGAYDPTMGGAFNPVAPISGVTVTCMMSAPHWGGWVPWPAHLYDQVNPQVTDDAYPDGVTTPGYYAFFTPPGHYYIQVEGIEGYQAWRSPVVEVITQIVHVNVPYTPWAGDVDALVDLTPDGPSAETITISAGSTVEWRALLRATDTITDLITWSENPLLRPLSNRDPLEDTRGFDAGYLEPGQTYRRTFAYPGSYPYTVHGKTGEIIVTGDSPHDYVYLPLVLRRNP